MLTGHLTQLGFLIAPEKIEGPSTTLKFVAIELDFVSWEAHLLLARIHSIVYEWRGYKSVKHTGTTYRMLPEWSPQVRIILSFFNGFPTWPH